MKKIGLVIVVVAMLVFVAGCISSNVNSPAGGDSNKNLPSASGNGNACLNPEPLKHVYNPGRLTVLESCKTVSGTVVRVLRPEKDGDYHIQLKVDPQYSDVIDQANIDKQHGNLVLEIVCANKDITQKDAVSACSGYQNKIPLPKPNEHISVIGQFVSDKEHGGWNEIHPVYQIIEG